MVVAHKAAAKKHACAVAMDVPCLRGCNGISFDAVLRYFLCPSNPDGLLGMRMLPVSGPAQSLMLRVASLLGFFFVVTCCSGAGTVLCCTVGADGMSLVQLIAGRFTLLCLILMMCPVLLQT